MTWELEELAAGARSRTDAHPAGHRCGGAVLGGLASIALAGALRRRML